MACITPASFQQGSLLLLPGLFNDHIHLLLRDRPGLGVLTSAAAAAAAVTAAAAAGYKVKGHDAGVEAEKVVKISKLPQVRAVHKLVLFCYVFTCLSMAACSGD
jgi:hypothetical protein